MIDLLQKWKSWESSSKTSFYNPISPPSPSILSPILAKGWSWSLVHSSSSEKCHHCHSYNTAPGQYPLSPEHCPTACSSPHHSLLPPLINTRATPDHTEWVRSEVVLWLETRDQQSETQCALLTAWLQPPESCQELLHTITHCTQYLY